MSSSVSPSDASWLAPKPRRYQQIADSLKEGVLSGALKPGDRLPTERELAAAYSVSRTCIREALLALEIAGMVSIRVGSGVYVLPPPLEAKGHATDAAPQAPVPSVSEVMEARLIFEPEICAAAAMRAGSEDLARLHATHALMREPREDPCVAAFIYREFHLGVVRATGNPIAQRLMREIWQATQVEAWVELRRYLQSPQMQPRWRDDHATILAAIADRHRGRARGAMRAHLESVATTLDDAGLI